MVAGRKPRRARPQPVPAAVNGPVFLAEPSMLKNTFVHVPGIGDRTEQSLWNLGIHSWEILLADSSPRLPIAGKRASELIRHIDESVLRLEEGDVRYFAGLLTPGLYWRFFPDFMCKTAYLDIETTGLGSPDDHVTAVTVYDGTSIRCFVHGENMDSFAEEIDRFDVIVTFNGKCFDIPFLRNCLGVPMDQVHIDLRYILAALGYRGGLKGCERRLGIARDELDGVDGFFAVLLWDEYVKNRNPRALETLLAYNIADTVNLERLMVEAYNRKVAQTPFSGSLALQIHPPPPSPFSADTALIKHIRQKWVHSLNPGDSFLPSLH